MFKTKAGGERPKPSGQTEARKLVRLDLEFEVESYHFLIFEESGVKHTKSAQQ